MSSPLIALTGYQIAEIVYQSQRTLVYRGQRLYDQMPVIIKLLWSEYPSFSELVQFRNQYTITKNFDIDGIVKPYNLENYRNSYALIMEDFGGISLKDWGLGKKNLPITNFLSEFLFIAIQIAQILDELHRHRVIHKDLKPTNILINPETKHVKLTDFSIASLLLRETQEILTPKVLEGTLAYLSPEQTGRMNRGIDYRSDFYGLGVTFFELLTGQLPFQSHDPMELVHCHIAKQPPRVYSINPSIPPILSDIIGKLMAKNAEDRYQNALGLKHDLEKCQHRWKAGRMDSFELGQRDICDRFIIPEKLYGREAEVRTLLNAFERVSQGTTEIMLIAGFSGIGKTAVVNEVHKPIVRQRGYFIQGKFDQFQRNIPFYAFLQAFRDLMKQLLSESDRQLEHWKSKILSTLGENGQVIIEVIPELERIIGPQPQIAQSSGSAAQNRFNRLFQKFIHVFTTNEHPLIIFLDDLQWADSASLKLMQLLMSDASTSYLFLIGAYRDNEVSKAHPLMLTLADIAKAGTTINTITLAPLNQFDINQLVADTLSCSPKLAQPLTELVYQKTKGNPFFTNQFLKSLYEDALITFNFQQGYWQCDIAKVRVLALTDDVVEFMALQLQKLPQSTQFVLKLAACIGNSFDLATLAIVQEKSQEETSAVLWKALQEGFILPKSQAYKFFQGETATGSLRSNFHEQLAINNEPIHYKFLHDRVQQAAYFLIPEDQKQSTHQKIGQLLLNNTDGQAREEKIFDIVNQLNIGAELFTQQSERDELAQLNLVAGRKAKASTAYEAALKYLSAGIEVLAADCWQTQYNVTLTLHEEATEVTYLSGNFEQVEPLAGRVLQNVRSLLDQVKVYEVKIQTYLAQNQLEQAFHTAVGVLSLLGCQLPKQPTRAKTLLGLVRTKVGLFGKSPTDLMNLPTMTEPQKLATMRILASASSAAYTGLPELLPLIVFSKVNLSLKYGNTALSAVAYVLYALILCGVLFDIESGYQFGQLSLQVLEQFHAQELKSKTVFILNCFVNHWHDHVKDTIRPLLEAYQSGLETGDIEYASWSAYVYSYHLYCIGKELTELEKEMGFYAEATNQLKQEKARIYINTFRQATLNLLGQSENPCCLQGDSYNENKILPWQYQANDKTGISLCYLNQLILSYLFCEYFEAIKNAELAKKYLDGITASYAFALFYFYDSLAQLAIYNNAGKIDKKSILLRVKSNQKKMKEWAYHAPMNHLHKFYLVEAERYRVLNKTVKALEHYDRAISLAKENEYLQEEAIAHELAAKFYLEWGKEKIAIIYMTDAYYAYSRWGAKAKVDDLEKRYPQLLAPVLQQEKNSLNSPNKIYTQSITSLSFHNTLKTTFSNSTSISEVLDLKTVIKATLAISGEIHLSKLLFALMQVVLENAGASKGALVLCDEDNLRVAISCVSESECNLEYLPISENQEIALSIINHVKHTLEILVINDATVETTFAADPYIIREQPLSLLCSPILNQGKLIGILYLENNLVTRAFTSDHIFIFNLLCSQAAISLENARLYQQAQDYAHQSEQSLNDLKQMQLQLVQSEKMSALGNLVAGVAHEINNPIGFIAGNLQPAVDYVQDLFGLIDLYQQKFPHPGVHIEKEIKAIDLEYLREDLPKLIASMQEGVDRIYDISTSLRTFSRADSKRKVEFNIHEGIDSTLLILKHRLKANENRPEIQVIKNYGNLPQVECFVGQLNQVFMNILANAIDALEESNTERSFADIQANPNRITIRTTLTEDNHHVLIQIQDNGIGMSDQVKQKIFDHLFTTKAVGKGTGLGLSITHQIIVEKHGGSLEVNSSLGQGTSFVVAIPVKA